MKNQKSIFNSKSYVELTTSELHETEGGLIFVLVPVALGIAGLIYTVQDNV